MIRDFKQITMSSKSQMIMKYLLSYMMLWACCVNLVFMKPKETVNSHEIIDDLELDIGNKKEAKEGEFPWMVSLYFNGRFICSSFLISKDSILTSAHCVKTEDGVPPAALFYGIAGNINRKGPGTRIHFREVVAHPQFDANQDLEYDIAFLRLSCPVEMNKFIQPICLPKDDRSIDIESIQTMGWRLAYDRINDVAENMMSTELSILPRNICNQTFVKYKSIKITNEDICVYSPKPTRPCYDYSGSPAVYNDPDSGKPVAIGVASFISYYGCFIPKAPVVYTRIASYIKWLKEAVGDCNYICFI